jgi:flagellar hook-associated protein 3 FlgL
MPSITRISTYAVHQRSLSDFNSTQVKLVDLQRQISSGIKADDFEGLNGQVEQFVGLEAKMRKLEQYSENNSESISRFQTQRDSVSQMIEVADDMEDLITLWRSANKDEIAFAPQMENLRQQMARELNISLEGRYLFGGTRTEVPPVVNEPSIPRPFSPGIPDDGYYQGSSENVVIRPQDNVEAEFDVRADNLAFQQIFAASSLALDADVTDNDSTMRQALDLMQEGMKNMTGLQARLDSEIVNLENINERHDNSILYFKGVTERIAKTDLVEASTLLAQEEAVLQASFQAFSRVNNLRLSDFLN